MAGAPGLQYGANFNSLRDLDPVLTEIFYQHLMPRAPKASVFFRTLGSTKMKETDQRIGGFRDPQEFKGQIDYRGADPDFSVTYTHTEYADGFKVERKLFDDMQYEGIFSAPAEMGTAFGRKREKDAASVFNNAFTTEGYDSAELCADDHPRSESDTTAVDNEATLALGKANLDTVRQQLRALVDSEGELVSINPDILLVPPELEMTAFELVRSQRDPETADNAENLFYRSLQMVVWDYLTDANAWFLIDSVLAKRYLKWYDRISTEFGATGDFDTMQRKYRGYMRYSFGWSDFRWVVGSNPS